MLKLEDVQPGLPVLGLEPSVVTTVAFVSRIGEGSLQVVYRTPDGVLKERLLGRADEPSISFASAERPWSFDGDGAAYQLACEATKAAWPEVHYGASPPRASSIGRRFVGHFPDMARVIDAMRYRNCLVQKDSRPYRYLACMLELYESTVMIGRVCARIMREQPDCPLRPIHDCILTTEPYQTYVLQVLREEYAKVGLCLRFHTMEIGRD